MDLVHRSLALQSFRCWLRLGGFLPSVRSPSYKGGFRSVGPAPDAVNAEGSCFWVCLFVIIIIKHLSAVYTMVCKYAHSGLQTGAGFLLPLELVARVPLRSVGLESTNLLPGASYSFLLCQALSGPHLADSGCAAYLARAQHLNVLQMEKTLRARPGFQTSPPNLQLSEPRSCAAEHLAAICLGTGQLGVAQAGDECF